MPARFIYNLPNIYFTNIKNSMFLPKYIRYTVAIALCYNITIM